MNVRKTVLVNSFNLEDIYNICGVDIAYWEKDNKTFGVCSIVVVDYINKTVIEKKRYYDEITYPYIPGKLAY